MLGVVLLAAVSVVVARCGSDTNEVGVGQPSDEPAQAPVEELTEDAGPESVTWRPESLPGPATFSVCSTMRTPFGLATTPCQQVVRDLGLV